MISPRRTDYDQFDTLNPPGEPEPEEAGAVASGGSQSTELSTWDTFNESTDYSKKEKKKSSMLGKARKNLKKAFKSSDHVIKIDEKHADENDEQTSGGIREVPQNISGTKGKHKLPIDEEYRRRVSKKESITDNSELARQLYESELYKEKVRVKASQVEKVKEELQADFMKLQDKWKTEYAAFQTTIQEYQTGFIQLKQKHKLDSLKNYEIKEVHCIKSKVNAGSYGSISLVSVNGMLCIQKCLHDILVGLNGTEAVGEIQQRSISEKFYEECRLLWKMRHPNIVQFMGIHYNEEVGEMHKMSLIMEYLPSNVEECITKCSQANYSIPGSIKISVFRDVTYGLSHLHANDIIHRDLSAANILLTYSMGAKIADLGVSKLVSPSSNTKFTAAPGANYIMPPEALEENPHYSSKLDIFSLGIFILYLISQKEPVPRRASLNSEHVDNKQIEIGMRLSHIHLLRSKNPELIRVVVQALQDRPDLRPTAANLCIPINNCFQKVKHQFYHDLADFINSIGKDILVFPDC